MNIWREQSEAYVKEFQTAERLWEYYRQKAAKPRFIIMHIGAFMNGLLMFSELYTIIFDQSDRRTLDIILLGVMIIVHLIALRYAGRDIRFREETIIYALYLMQDEKAVEFVKDNEWRFEKFSEAG